MVEATPDAVGRLAAEHGVVLHRLVENSVGLEDVFLRLTEPRDHRVIDAFEHPALPTRAVPAGAVRAGAVPMPALIRAELLKFRTIRMTPWLLVTC